MHGGMTRVAVHFGDDDLAVKGAGLAQPSLLRLSVSSIYRIVISQSQREIRKSQSSRLRSVVPYGLRL
eukprot:5708410-Prymnesium_polylepis.1